MLLRAKIKLKRSRFSLKDDHFWQKNSNLKSLGDFLWLEGSQNVILEYFDIFWKFFEFLSIMRHFQACRCGECLHLTAKIKLKRSRFSLKHDHFWQKNSNLKSFGDFWWLGKSLHFPCEGGPWNVMINKRLEQHFSVKNGWILRIRYNQCAGQEA